MFTAPLIVITGNKLDTVIPKITEEQYSYKLISYPENSLNAWQKIAKALLLIDRVANGDKLIIFTHCTYILETLCKSCRDTEQEAQFFIAKDNELIDYSDNTPELFRDNSEAMQALLFMTYKELKSFSDSY